jgi:hypothetical protein
MMAAWGKFLSGEADAKVWQAEAVVIMRVGPSSSTQSQRPRSPTGWSTWQQITTCSSPGGYVSHESQWQGVTTGDDNQRRQVDIVAVAGH